MDSTRDYIEAMAEAVAEGARSVAGTTVDIKRVPELVPDEVAAAAHIKVNQAAPIATPDELANYDAIIFGTPTRFGNMAAQMRNFLDQTGGLWFANALVGKVGSVFCSTASQHGGQEMQLEAGGAGMGDQMDVREKQRQGGAEIGEDALVDHEVLAEAVQRRAVGRDRTAVDGVGGGSGGERHAAPFAFREPRTSVTT